MSFYMRIALVILLGPWLSFYFYFYFWTWFCMLWIYSANKFQTYLMYCNPPSSGWIPKIWERDLLLEAKRSRRTRIDDLERLINKPDTSAYLSYYVATPPRCETKSKMRDRRGKYCNLNSTNPDSSRVREAFIF